MKKIISSLLSLSLVLSLFSSSALAADISTSGSSGDVPVELTQEATVFSVTVTTVLPVDVDAGGVVTVSTNNKIINNSWGPVEVKSVLVEPQNSWVLKDFNTDFTKSKVGAKEFGFQINGENVSADGSCSTDTFSQIDGGGELNFDYDAIIAAQNIALEDVQIANVVFVIGWNEVSTTYASTFADNSWEEIIEACETDAVPSTWNVGDTKPMTIDGQTYNIQIIGKDHDTYTSGGTAPLTFQLVELYGTKYQMNSYETNTTGWSGSLMRNTNLPAILSTMPIEVSSAIKSIDKSTIRGDGNNSLEVTSDTLFLLSEYEVLGTTERSGGVAEGIQYEYYVNGGSAVKTLNGTANLWVLRSPYFTHYSSFTMIGTDGFGYVSNYMADDYLGVAFGFCF